MTNSSSSSSGSVWMFFVLAMIPVLIALIIPALPQLVTRLESIKVGGFEAKLQTERLAAGAGATAIVSERSAGEGYADLEAWAKFDDGLAIQADVGRALPPEVGLPHRIEDFRHIYVRLLKPITNLVGCQLRLGFPTQRMRMIVDDMIVALRFGQGMERPTLLHHAGLDEPKIGSAFGQSMQAALRELEPALHLASINAGHDCQQSIDALDLAIESIVFDHRKTASATFVSFSDSGYLTMFVATLMSIDGSPKAELGALQLMVGMLDRDMKEPFLTPFERLNLLFLSGRSMRQARWEASLVLDTQSQALETARLLRQEVLRAAQACRRQRDRDGGQTRHCTSRNQDTLQAYGDYLDRQFKTRIRTEILAIYIQYSQEGIPIEESWIPDLERWLEELARRIDRWRPNIFGQNSRRVDKDSANAAVNVAILRVLLAERNSSLSRPLCASSDAAIDEAESVWSNLDVRTRSGETSEEIGAVQAPIVLVQKYKSYTRAVCESHGF